MTTTTKTRSVIYDKLGIKVEMFPIGNGSQMYSVERVNPITHLRTYFETTIMPYPLQFGHLCNLLNDHEDMKFDDMNETFAEYEIINE